MKLKTPEVKNPAKIGGSLEVGGSMTFSIKRRYSYPYLKVQDNNSFVLYDMLDNIGLGRINPRREGSGQSSEFKALGLAIPDIASQFSEFAPSRVTIISTFLKWRDATTLEKRLSIAQAASIERDPVEVERYLELLKNPDFLTGVIDGRGFVYSDPRRPNTRRFIIDSVNRPLLEAFKSRFGGGIEPARAEERGKNVEEVKGLILSISRRAQINAIFNSLSNSARFPKAA